MEEASDILWRLAEAIAWCSGRPRDLDPGDGLWTPSLRPSTLSERPPYAEIEASYRPPPRGSGRYFQRYDRLWSHPTPERIAIVAELCAARAEALRRAWRYPTRAAANLAGGRLVLFAGDESLSDGAAEAGTRGFFDVDNLPGWDTWVCYVEDAERSAARQRWMAAGRPRDHEPIRFESYLVSWVPPHLRALVSYGIWVNPENCIEWADVADTAFVRQLRALGIG